MDLYIFIDVNNPGCSEDQTWNDEKCKAVYRALCKYEGIDSNQAHVNIQQFIQEQCYGSSFSISFEYHRDDKSPLDDITKKANNLHQHLENECKDIGLIVTMSSGV